MSVSSVKNLNGESFSAVQDAELTDIVSSNSAIWNEASAIADKLDASSTDNSNIQYNDNKLYVKAVSSYGIEVIATGHMNGNIVYDEPFNLGTPHCFSSKYGAAGPIFGFSAFDENDILLYTASSDNINSNYKLSRYNMNYVGYGVAGADEMAPIKYFSFSCSNTQYDNYGISAYKNISATGYSTSDEFALAKNVIRNEGNGNYDVYSKDGTLILTSPYNTELQIYANGMSVFNHLHQNVSNIYSSSIGLGYSSDNNDYKFYVNASQYSSDRVIRLKDVITANSDALCTNYMTANNYYGFTFSSQNTGFGTAQLTTAYGNQIVQMTSPKFEARNVSGAGFCIEASGAKGYDHNGNITWDTTKAPAPQQLIAGSDSTKPSILLSNYIPASNTASFSSAPLFSADGNGYTIGILTSDYGPRVKSDMQGISALNGTFKSYIQNGPSAQMYYLNGFYHSYGPGAPTATFNADGIAIDNGSAHLNANTTDVQVLRYTAWKDPDKKTWSLTGSVQKSEIECDTATSAITAIAGSAVGTYNETVLFDGVISSNETAMLSEPASAFERIKVYGYLDSDLADQYYPWYTECTTTSGYIRAGAWTNDPFDMNCFCFIINPSGGFINATGRACAFGQTAWNVIDNWATTKVIGVNRKPIVVEEQSEE